MKRSTPAPLVGTASLVVLALATLPGPRLAACSCIAPPPPPKALAEAAAVFTGRVIEVAERPGAYGISVKLEVLDVWKGLTGGEVSVTTGFGGGDCGYPFAEGQDYLVYALGRESLSTDICTRTASLALAGADLAALGEPLVVPSGVDGESKLKAPLIIGAAILVGFVVVGLFDLATRKGSRRRRR